MHRSSEADTVSPSAATEPTRRDAAVNASLQHLLLPVILVPQQSVESDVSTASDDGSAILSASDSASTSASSESKSETSVAGSADGSDSSTGTESSDPDVKLRIRHRERLLFPRITTAAGQQARLDLLRRQHIRRVDDRIFCSAEDGPPRYGWADFRERLVRPFALRSYLPRVTEASPIGLQTRGFAALAAASCAPGALLSAFLHRCDVATSPFVVLCVAGDAIGAAFPGGPHGGKIFSLWIKPLSVTASFQSPHTAVPIMVMLGNDSRQRLERVCQQWEPTRHLSSLPPRLPLGGGRSARPILFCIGDLAFCTSVQSLPRLNRPFPTSAGRVRYFAEPMCWFCGVGGCHLYSRESWYGGDHRSRLQGHWNLLGLRLDEVFYAPVHAVLNVFSQLLADICHAYIAFIPPGRPKSHPVASHIASLFPSDQWDPLLKLPKPAGEARRSRRPFHHVDPGFIFGFLRSEHAATLTRLIRENDFTWRAPSNCAFAEVGRPRGSTPAAGDFHRTERRSCLALWLTSLRWFDTIVDGHADVCTTYGCLLLDLWFELLAHTRPIPRTVTVHGDPKPSFYVPVAGFGPASHIAVCSMPRMIRFLRRFLPADVLRRTSFLKIAAEIWLEHAQATIRRCAMDFNIASKVRHRWAEHLLQRSVEAALVRLLPQPDVVDEDPWDGRRTGDAAQVRTTNRAYKECGLTERIPESTYRIASGTWEGEWFGI